MYSGREFKFSLWSEQLILVFGLLSGLLFTGHVSEHLVGSIFWVDEMEPTRCPETSVNKHNTPGNNPKTRINQYVR
jgi:hypothetical protein